MSRKVPRRKRKFGNIHISLHAIKEYLLNRAYPTNYCSPSGKRCLRKRADSFKVVDDELYYIARPKRLDNEPIEENLEDNQTNYRRAILTEREQLSLTTRLHVGDTGVHKGSERTLNAITAKYYWVGISASVRQVIKNCTVCMCSRTEQGTKYEMSKSSVAILNVSKGVSPPDKIDDTQIANGLEERVKEKNDGDNTGKTEDMPFIVTSELPNHEDDPDLDCDVKNVFGGEINLLEQSDILKAKKFWERVEIQIVSPNDENVRDGRRRKKSYIVLAVDSFSKWPEAQKLEKLNEQTVSHFIIKLIARFGVMNQLVFLENDRSFILSGIIQNLSAFEIIIISESVNPFDNFWDLVIRTVCNFIDRYPESWVSCLDFCLMPLRNSVFPKTDFTPAFATMGREPTFPSFLFPSKESSQLEVMLTQEQIESATNTIMNTYQDCSEADVKQVISPLESIQLNVNAKKAPVKEGSLGIRRSGRKVTVPHLLNDYEGSFTAASDYDNGDSTFDDNKDTNANEVENLTQSDLYEKEKHCLLNCEPPPESGDNKKDKPGQNKLLKTRVSMYKRKVDGEDVFEKLDIGMFYRILRQKLECDTYPLNSPESFKRVIRQAVHNYCMEDGKLMYTHKNKKKAVVVTLKERLEILNEIHTMSVDHVPRGRMAEEMDHRMIHWKNVGGDIEAYVKTCPDCKHGSTRRPKTKKKKWQGDSDDEDGFSDNEKFQNATTFYSDVIDFLEGGTLPSKMSRAELVVFKKRTKNFKLVDGVLCYCPSSSAKKQRRVLLTEEERCEVMQEAHGESHLPSHKMLLELRKSYHWRPMSKDVDKFVSVCCQPETETVVEKTDEVNWRIEMFKKHFNGEDIVCNEAANLDTLFPSPDNEETHSVVKDVKESLDEKTGQLVKQGPRVSQQDDDFQVIDTDTGQPADTLSKLKAETSKDIDGSNNGALEDGVEDVDDDVMMTEPESAMDEDNVMKENIADKTNPFGLIKTRGVKHRCNICQILIRGDNHFKEHMYRHDGVKPFMCQVCSKLFTTVKGMRMHMRKHTGYRPYLCNLCGRDFPRYASLRYHIKTHEKGGGVALTCEICKREFSTNHRLQKHMRFKHPAQKPVYKCDTCGKHFTAKRSLKRHEEAHQGIRRYVCEFCKRSFFRKEYLTYHLDSHYKDNPSMSHLTSKRKFKRRANQRLQDDNKEENANNTNILSILTVDPEMGQEEVYTQLVEVTNPHEWTTEGATHVTDGAMPTVFSIDGNLQVSEVVEQVNAGTAVVMVQEHTATTADQEIEMSHIISNTQTDANEQLPQDDGNLTQHIVHQPDIIQSDQVQVTMPNGQKVTLSRTGGTTIGDQGQETVQYHVECLSGESLSEADLNAISMLAQSSVLQQ